MIIIIIITITVSPELSDVVRSSPGFSLGEIIIVQAVGGALELHVLGVVEDGAEDVGEDGGGPRAGGDTDGVPVSAEDDELAQDRLLAAQHDTPGGSLS